MAHPPSKSMVVSTQYGSSQYHFASSGELNDKLMDLNGPLEYNLKMVQEPKRSRMSGVGDKPNRRTIDPPPVAQLEITDRFANDVTYPLVETSPFFAVIALVDPDTKEPVGPVYFNDRVMMPLVGDRAVSVQRANGTSETELEAPEYKAVFVFSDLSVRQEGRYRLQVHVFQIVHGEILLRATVYSLPFRTFTPKKFPGMQSSTDTTAELKRNGIKMRYKKSIRLSNTMKRELENTAKHQQLRTQEDRTVTTFMNISNLQQPNTDNQLAPPTPRVLLPVPDHSGSVLTSLNPFREQRVNVSLLSPPPYQNSVRRQSEENYGRYGEPSFGYRHPTNDQSPAIRHHFDRLRNTPYPTAEQRRYSLPGRNIYTESRSTHQYPGSRLPHTSDIFPRSKNEYTYEDPVYGPNVTPHNQQPAHDPRDGTARHQHQYQPPPGRTTDNEDHFRWDNNY